MGFVWQTARKDLLRLMREPAGLLAWIGIPVFIALLMGVLFGRGEVRPRGIVLVADQDDSMVSRLVAGAFSQDRMAEMFTVEKVKEDEGRKRMNEGKASALVVIPKGFGDAVLAGTESRLVVVKNPAQQIMPQMVEQVVKLLAEAGFYLQELAGDELRAMNERQPTEAEVALMSVRLNRMATQVSKWMRPPRFAVETQVVEEKKQQGPPVGFASLMLPGMLVMGLLFTASGLSMDWWKEKQDGTLRRVLSTPNGPASVLGGKLLAYALLASVVSGVGLAAAHAMVGLAVPRVWATMGWAVTVSCCGYLAFVLLQSLASQRRVGEMLVNMVMLPLCMLGGCFFPLEMMPANLAAVGRWTPTGMALAVMRDTLAPQSGGMWWAVPAAAVTGAALFVLCARQARRRFAF